MHLVNFLDQGAKHPSAGSFVDLDQNLSLSYGQVIAASNAIADLLREKGVKPQDVVATYAPNSVAAYCCIFAISRCGAVWLPINIRNTFDANKKLIGKADAKVLFVDESVNAKFPQLNDSFDQSQLVSLNGGIVEGIDLASLESQAVVDEIPEDCPLVNLFSTGGTTGDSKLAEWTSTCWDTMVAIQNERMPSPDIPITYLVSAPMTHAAGVASFACIGEGASVVVMDGMVPERVLSAIEEYRVTHLFMPPTAIYMLLADANVRRHNYGSLRYFWYAAAPMSVEKLKEALDVFGPVMVQSYGQAEAPMLCTFLTAEDHVRAVQENRADILRSCGTVSSHVELVIMDDDWNILPSNTEGEVAVRGNLLMGGYYRSGEATEEIRRDGWQRTGDIGVLSEDGYLAIVDRKRDMIISGGFNVYPGEIEQLIWGHPAIKDCAVIGIPDDKWGEQVTAVVELKDTVSELDAQEVIDLCKAKLGSVKAPKAVIVWDELPRSPVGKVLKKDIRQVFWNEAGRSI